MTPDTVTVTGIDPVKREAIATATGGACVRMAPAGSAGNWIAVGVVRGAFGVQGALKIAPYSDAESTVLNRVRRWRVAGPSASPQADRQLRIRPLPFPLPAVLENVATRTHGGFIIATVSPAISREQAMALKGVEVLVERQDFPLPEADEYYWTDLIGCRVVDPAGRSLGTVAAVEEHAAHAVLRLENRILIPFVAAHILEVAPERKRIVANWSTDWT